MSRDNQQIPLPTELLVRIFSYLSPKQLLPLLYVSKEFKEISRDMAAWKEKYLLHFSHLIATPIIHFQLDESDFNDNTMANDEQKDDPFLQRFKVESGEDGDEIEWDKAFYYTSKQQYRNLPGQIPTLFELVKEGASGELKTWTLIAKDLDRKDAHGMTVICWAKKYNYQTVLDIFYQQSILREYMDSTTNFIIPNIKDAHGRTIIHQAIRCRQSTDVVKLLREQQVDLHAIDNATKNALHYAAEDNQTAMIEFLVENGMNINATTQYNATALILAIERDCLDAAVTLLRLKTDTKVALNLTEESSEHSSSINGDTALHVAVNLKRAHFLKPLLSANTPIDIKNGSKTPLVRAAQVGDNNSMKILIAHGANMNQLSDMGASACLFSLENKHDDVLFTLIDNKADINTPLRENSDYHNNFNVFAGDTPLHVAIKQKRLPIVRKLVAAGASLTALTANGLNAVQLAAQQDHLAIFEFLCTHTNINEHNGNGETLLLLAIASRSVVNITFLLANQADTAIPLYTDRPYTQSLGLVAGDTPLLYAIRMGFHDIVKQLLDHGADTSGLTDSGHDALFLSILLNQIESLKHLLSANVATAFTFDDLNALQFAASLGHVEIASALVESGIVDIDDEGTYGASPLIIAVANKHSLLVERLLNLGALTTTTVKKVDTEFKNLIFVGDTPLHVAVAVDSMQDMVSLLSANADLNAVTKNGYTPLHLACELNVASIIETLCNHININTNKRSTTGATALFFAMGANAALPTLENLLKKKANTSIRFEFNPDCFLENFTLAVTKDTPLHFAIRLGKIAYVKKLLEYGANPKALTADGDNALRLAIKLGKEEIALHLIQHPKININAVNRCGEAALLLATERGLNKVALALIEKDDKLYSLLRSDNHYQSKFNTVLYDSPLHVSARLGNEVIATALIRKNPDLVFNKNILKNKPLDVVADKKSTIAYLLKLAEHKVASALYSKSKSKIPQSKSPNAKLQNTAFDVGHHSIDDKKNASRALYKVTFFREKFSTRYLKKHEKVLKCDELRFIYKGLGFK